MLDLTILIITKNEEKNIEKCINSILKIAKRIVIVDSGSTDKTKEICIKYSKVNFYYNDWINHSHQINWALKNTNISTKWVFRLDADEEITKKLEDEIIEKLDKLGEDITGIYLKRRMYFMGKWIKHGGMYPIKNLRIIKNGYGLCENKEMDEHLITTKGKNISFQYDFIDYNNNQLEWWISKHNWYSGKEKKEYFKIKEKKEEDLEKKGLKRIFKNKGYYNLPLFMRARFYYIYRYYIKLGFLDGTEGKIYHFLQAYWYRFLVDAKIYEETKGKK